MTAPTLTGRATGSRPLLQPGASVLGGAAAGFTYDSALRDALGSRARPQQMQAGHAAMPAQQVQGARPAPAIAQAQRQQG